MVRGADQEKKVAAVVNVWVATGSAVKSNASSDNNSSHTAFPGFMLKIRYTFE